MTVFVLSPGPAGPLTPHLLCRPRRRILPTSDSYNGDDARHYLHEWRMAQNRYSEATWENGQLKICLGVYQAALNATKEKASAVRAWLSESNAAVAGKMSSINASILISSVFILIVVLFL